MLSAEPTLNLTKFVGAVRALRTGSAEFVGSVASQDWYSLDGCALEEKTAWVKLGSFRQTGPVKMSWQEF